MSEKTESGLSRWARRKAATREARDASGGKRGAALPAAVEPDASPHDPTAAAAPAGNTAGTPDSQVGTAADQLPDIETLDYDSDYAGFLSEDVSDAVRNIALRKLWRSNPLLANVDGLVDYDDDFTDAATVIEGMKSVYRVGRGMVEDEPERAEETPTSMEADPDQPPAEDEGVVAADAAPDEPAPPQQPETQSNDSNTPREAVAEETEKNKDTKPVDAT